MKKLLLATLLIAAPYAQAADDWLGKDKQLHFAGSAIAAAAVTAATGDENVGFWSIVAVGAAKEVWDKSRPNHTASWRDLAWDVAGAYVGAKTGGWAISKVSGQTVVSFNTKF